MPKKASMTPATKQPKKTRMPKAKTDQNWDKLTSHTPTAKAPIRQKKITETSTKNCSLEYSKDEEKFPHTGFPIRLEYKEGNDKKTQCYNHFEKHITRYKVTEYVAITNDMALVGEVTGAKSKRV
jgi:predicted hydrolase (HD superfamily)